MEAAMGESHHPVSNEGEENESGDKSQELPLYQQRLSGRFKSESSQSLSPFLSS